MRSMMRQSDAKIILSKQAGGLQLAGAFEVTTAPSKRAKLQLAGRNAHSFRQSLFV